MHRNILAFVTVVLLLLFIPKDSFAAVLFEDDFEDGDKNGWTFVLGPNLWEVKEINGNKMLGARINGGSTLIDIVGPTINLSSYQIDFDYMPVTGADRNLDFRWIFDPVGGGYNPYEVHYIGPNYAWNNFGAPSIDTSLLVNSAINHIKVILDNQRVQFYVNQVKIIDHIVPDYEYTSEKVGLRLGTGASFPTEGWFDNVRVTTLDHEDDHGLNVPPLKQTDSLWADDIYDSANLWASSNPTIGRWGCAITSAAMVLNYHNITKLPNGSSLTPLTLNEYLKSVPDGYKRNGETNWKKAADIAKLASTQNPNFEYDALEFEWAGYSMSNLEEDINNNIPNILQVTMPNGGMHFVVAKGVDSENVLINDPGFNNSNLDFYNNTYSSARRYIPSNSDVSYIMLVIDPEVDIELRDSNGNIVGNEVIEGPIGDPLGLLINSVGPLKTLYLPKPASGEYELNVTSPDNKSYILDQYFYDMDGGVSMITVGGELSNGQTHTYIIAFDKNNSENSDSTKVVTYESLRQSIVNGYNQHKLEFGTYVALLALLNNAEKANKPEIFVKMLDQMILLISKDKKIAFDFAQELTSDINTLKESF